MSRILLPLAVLIVGVSTMTAAKRTLTTYHKKRTFTKTTEPKGSIKKQKGEQLLFVVQKHDASHLHYDFRLEIGGVMPSWAVPKGIPKTADEKHLAIQTEDHPIDYAHFEGTIPEGNYGAGTVMVWDIGHYENLKKIPMHKALEQGRIEIELFGKKLKGPFALVRTRIQGDKAHWLLLKMKENSYTARYTEKSALTNRTLLQIARDTGEQPVAKKKRSTKK